MSIQLIQAVFKGFIVRKHFTLARDSYTLNNLKLRIKSYCEYTQGISNINKSLPKSHKIIRSCNLPEDISENLAKFAIFKKYKKMPSWNCTGDLELNGKKLEVKGFTSTGPTSFGPGTFFYRLYFVDATKIMENSFKVYEISLESSDSKFLNIMINKNETFEEIAKKNQRGKLRGSFYKVFKPQLKNNCKLIFSGTIENLE